MTRSRQTEKRRKEVGEGGVQRREKLQQYKLHAEIIA